MLCVVRVLRALLCAAVRNSCAAVRCVCVQKAMRDHIHKKSRKTYAQLVEGEGTNRAPARVCVAALC